jgi:hypothetical protein
LISSGASEDAERARLPRYYEVRQSEAPQGSEILPRWGKMSVPARNKTRHTLKILKYNYEILFQI